MLLASGPLPTILDISRIYSISRREEDLNVDLAHRDTVSRLFSGRGICGFSADLNIKYIAFFRFSNSMLNLS